MSAYEDIIKENDHKNWLKGSLALRITKEGLRDLVDGDSRSIQQRIHSSVLQARNLKPGTTCCFCLTENLFPCYTQGLCSHPRNCKFHDTPAKMYRPCPLHMCDDFRDEICRLHRFKGPSWKNSLADQWCVNHWEIAKCFMPRDGYMDVSSYAETDFNGILSLLINCTEFRTRFSFKMYTVPNILSQARDIGRNIRHSPDLKVTDANLNDYMTTLKTLLSDPTYLSSDRKAQEAVLKLNQLQADTLYISNEDAHEILDEARIVTETGKHQIEQAVTEGRHVIETGTLQLESSVKEGIERLKFQADDSIIKVSKQIHTDVLVPAQNRLKEDVQAGLKASKQLIKESTKIGERELHSRKSECIDALDKAVLEAMGKIRASDEEREEDLRQRLAKNYQKTLSSVSISPLLSDKDEMLDKFYVAPKIMEKDHKKVESSQKLEETPVTSYTNIFCKGDTFLSNIYVIGEAGMGKSTFSTKCALNWGKQVLHTFNFSSSSEHEFQDVEVLAKFDFLFHVMLRYSGDLCNLIHMITDQIISRIYLADEEDTGKETLLSVLSNRRCLILADGLDEWSHPCDTKCFCKEEEKVVPFLSPTIDATVVITSRPWRMAQHRVRDSRIDRYLKIEGVADSKRLVQNVLGCLSEKTESEENSKEFMSFIHKRHLSNLLSVPIVVMMLACLWFEGVGESFSLCEIYALMIEMMFERKTIKKYYGQQENTILPSCFQNAKNIFKYKPALLSIAKLAFDQIFSMDKKSTLVFKLIESLSREDVEIMLKTGIVRETKSQSLSMQSSNFSFIHKTVQEFLAALHLSYNPEKCHKVVELFYNRSGEILDISQVFIYICGLNSYLANQLSTMMCKTVRASYTGEMPMSNYVYSVDRPEYTVVHTLQRLIAKGHMEAYANNVTNIQLNLHFFILDVFTKNVSVLKTLLSINKYQVRYLRINGHEAKISKEEIQEVLSLSADTLTAFDLENRSGWYDLSTCRQLKYLCVRGKKSTDIAVNVENLVTCTLDGTSPALEKSVLMSLSSHRLNEGVMNLCSPLKNMELTFVKNLDLFYQTLPLLSNLEYLHIGFTDLSHNRLEIPASIKRIDLFKVLIYESNLIELNNIDTLDCSFRQCIIKTRSHFT